MKIRKLETEIDPRFFVTRSARTIYEFSSFAKILGVKFVERACGVIRDRENLPESTRAHWMRHHVLRLKGILILLEKFITEHSLPNDVLAFTQSNWNDFLTALSAQIHNKKIADNSKYIEYTMTNQLFAILAQQKALPILVKLDDKNVKKTLTPLENILKQKDRQGVISPQLRAPSPFAIRIDELNRTYDFTQFQPLARQFLLDALPHLKSNYSRLSESTATQMAGSLKNLLNFLAERKKAGADPIFFERLLSKEYKEITDIQWETVIHEWRDSVINPNLRKLQTSRHYIVMMADIWRCLVNAQLVPEISIARIRNARKRWMSIPRRSLAQIYTSSTSDESNADKAWDGLRRYFDQDDQISAHEFIKALCNKLTAPIVDGLTITELIAEMHKLNEERLQELRQCAELELLEWHRHWKHGENCLNNIAISTEELKFRLDSPTLTLGQQRKNSRELLFSGPPERQLGNALQYVLTTLNGSAKGIHGRADEITRLYGGHAKFHAYLHPHQNASLALWVLVLIDTGVNCEVARTIPWDCLEPSKPGYCRVQMGAKLRAGGKSIADELSELPSVGQKISTPEAIRLYKEMAARYHAIAIVESEHSLFLHNGHGGVCSISDSTATKWFVDFIERHESLRGLPMRPSMIRPSVLISVQARNSNDLFAAQAFGDHESATTTQVHYTGRGPITLRNNLMIREFTERFQAVVIASIDGAPAKLGLSEAEFQRILSDAHRTGLGVACLNPQAGFQKGTKPGEPCTSMDACCRCDMHYLVATAANVSDLILFNRQLKSAQENQIQLNPEGWESRWLPWLVFSDIAITKLSQGETAKIYLDAVKLADSLQSERLPFPLD